jgi:hypothetical protein
MVNLSSKDVSATMGGIPFGTEFPPGGWVGFRQVPARPAAFQIVDGGSGAVSVTVPIESGRGSTLIVLDDGPSITFHVVENDPRASSASAATVRAMIAPGVGGRLSVDDVRMPMPSSGEPAGAPLNVLPGSRVFRFQPAKVGRGAQTSVRIEEGAAYTALVRLVEGRAVLEVIPNRPRLARGTTFSNQRGG